jgi:hypothetical protein
VTPTSSASDNAARQRVRSSDHVRSQTAMGKIVRPTGRDERALAPSAGRGGSTPM